MNQYIKNKQEIYNFLYDYIKVFKFLTVSKGLSVNLNLKPL